LTIANLSAGTAGIRKLGRRTGHTVPRETIARSVQPSFVGDCSRANLIGLGRGGPQTNLTPITVIAGRQTRARESSHRWGGCLPESVRQLDAIGCNWRTAREVLRPSHARPGAGKWSRQRSAGQSVPSVGRVGGQSFAPSSPGPADSDCGTAGGAQGRCGDEDSLETDRFVGHEADCPTASVAHATTPRPLLESTVAAFDTRKRCHAWDVGTQSSPLPSLRGGEENASSSSIFPAVPASHMTRVPSQPGRVHFCPRVVTPRRRARSPPLLHSPTWAPGPMISPVYSAFLGRTRRPLRTLTAVTCPKGLAPVNAV
jgi:hypothetical protein